MTDWWVCMTDCGTAVRLTRLIALLHSRLYTQGWEKNPVHDDLFMTLRVIYI
jgi:hypothetical protein